jgi:hypothetical protein
MLRVGQNRIYTPYMTVYLMISLPKVPYIHRIYMDLANPTHAQAAAMWSHLHLHNVHKVLAYTNSSRHARAFQKPHPTITVDRHTWCSLHICEL